MQYLEECVEELMSEPVAVVAVFLVGGMLLLGLG